MFVDPPTCGMSTCGREIAGARLNPQGTSNLLVQHLFHLPNLFLHFSRYLLILSFAFQIGIVGGSTNLFLDCPFYLVKFALCLINGTWFHHMPPDDDLQAAGYLVG